MAILHNSNYQAPSFWQSIGNKVKTGAEVAGTMKGIWDVGRAVYHGVQAAAPVIRAVAGAIL